VWLRIKAYFSDDLHDLQSPNGHRCHHSSPAFVMVGMGSSLVNAKCRCKPTQPYSSPPEPNSDWAADQEMDEAHCSPLPPSPPTLVGRLSSDLSFAASTYRAVYLPCLSHLGSPVHWFCYAFSPRTLSGCASKHNVQPASRCIDLDWDTKFS
jgi:hypothetical protein